MNSGDSILGPGVDGQWRGVVETGTSPEAGHHQATLIFLPRCSLTSEQVRKHYMSGGPEAHESSGIIFVETQV